VVYLILFLGITASSSAAILIKMSDAHPLVIAAYRMTIASAILIPWSLARYRSETLDLIRHRTTHVVGSGIFLALHFASWISSLSHTSVASSALLVTTNPIFVGVGTWLLLKERIHPRLILGTAVALTGTFLISYGDLASGGHALYGDLLAGVGAVRMSGHLLIGRRLRRDTALTPYITVVYTIAALILSLFALSIGQEYGGYSSRNYGLFVALALGPQLLGHTSFNYALKRISPSVLVLLMLVEPIGSSILAYAVLNEMPPASTFLGGAVILAGVALALQRAESKTPS
jgi:drug/metabolite transporter (DMT)-like permease